MGSQESNSAVYVAIYCKQDFVLHGRALGLLAGVRVLTFCFLVELKYSVPLIPNPVGQHDPVPVDSLFAFDPI